MGKPNVIGNDSMRKPIGLTKGKNLDGDLTVGGIYGLELCLDCYECDVSKFNRKSLRQYFKKLVRLLDMKAGDLYFWDDVGVPKAERQTKPETTGTSAIQFILTSNITIHCLDILERVYVNIFSCKDFDTFNAKIFTQEYFNAGRVHSQSIYRE